MSKYHTVKDIRIENGVLSLIVDNATITCPLKDLPSWLSIATQQELELFEVSPAGYGIHWPTLDEGISIDGLLGILHYPEAIRESA